ncbi:MAG: hypothetical protein K0M49_17795 [Arenimonas sp.]|nr:hypothetical protein [Arenimonas sp.]
MTEQLPDRRSASGLRARLAASRPPVAEWLIGGLVWGGLITLCIILSTYGLHRLPTAHRATVLALYFSGAALGWIAALPLIRFAGHSRPQETRFAAAFLFLAGGTAAFTALLFALQYRHFYAQWHEPFGTRIWLFQFAFTSASAVYQFAVLGIRNYLPFGLILLIGASILHARRSR